ncbi:LytTR family transcriptional regulator DNA-binding domain-containing protein [Priestia megaterium]|uniref:LytTR family transcriptional regulator DNA-binding domain-containing protein n=1 Tax=Priestia megaterium TaxID=1404 RepID=UPI002E1C939C|nr:LytTR family transcriptional regulator DNA-binding domain-containing protein [Priestia megaterium]MED4285559.1 LytTR family transcriptional regulator DNA-binding domain-containing protein [Priestia megaterium]
MEERNMTVINEDYKLECINIYDVDFIETDKRKIIYFIGEKKYYQITTKSELDQFLYDEGFESLDRPNLVNLSKIRKFDEELGKVYFVEKPNDKSTFATVAKIKYKFVANIIKRIISHNNNTNTVVKAENEKVKNKLWRYLRQ